MTGAVPAVAMATLHGCIGLAPDGEPQDGVEAGAIAGAGAGARHAHQVGQAALQPRTGQLQHDGGHEARGHDHAARGRCRPARDAPTPDAGRVVGWR